MLVWRQQGGEWYQEWMVWCVLWWYYSWWYICARTCICACACAYRYVCVFVCICVWYIVAIISAVTVLTHAEHWLPREREASQRECSQIPQGSESSVETHTCMNTPYHSLPPPLTLMYNLSGAREERHQATKRREIGQGSCKHWKGKTSPTGKYI